MDLRLHSCSFQLELHIWLGGYSGNLSEGLRADTIGMRSQNLCSPSMHAVSVCQNLRIEQSLRSKD
eukprot:3049034-Amphidinium_carterae.1